jgi:hypothetical protein
MIPVELGSSVQGLAAMFHDAYAKYAVYLNQPDMFRR